jgi:hypothetical protein
MEKFYTPQTSKQLSQTTTSLIKLPPPPYIIALEGFGCPYFTKHVFCEPSRFWADGASTITFFFFFPKLHLHNCSSERPY